MSTVPRTPASKPVAQAPAKMQPPITPQQVPGKKIEKPCAHSCVQVVSRDEDSEFVECMECREIFESSELQDMAIEEKIDESDDQ